MGIPLNKSAINEHLLVSYQKNIKNPIQSSMKQKYLQPFFQELRQDEICRLPVQASLNVILGST